ncbi:putative flippase GtrA [Anaerobacterium chartisolvens]|uniref:Putative flippase GtrA n=1 Tax=Anaerobacterium chartisolvens TaxID=1297424 RepID=A0A369BKH7_9FIRM|nr:GtrA family protein [Anaerobacterium chartisolvens]RCX20194.1 putative flippase GtrA [Anaerobacterium chartisolvens]
MFTSDPKRYPHLKAVFFKVFKSIEVKELLRYLSAGMSAFLGEYAVFRVLFDLAGLQKFLANSAAMFLGFWISFLLNRFWSFKSTKKFLKQLLLYSVLFCINLVLSNLLMLIMSDRLQMSPSLSKIIIMVMIAAWNFVIFKKVVYK